MSDREKFLSEFSPIPEGAALPERILWEYEAQSCLAEPRDGRLVLRLRRKSDGVLAVLKAAPAGRENLAEEFQILNAIFPLLAWAGIIYAYFRMFSRNIYKRSAENQAFLARTYKLRCFFARQKIGHEDRCPVRFDDPLSVRAEGFGNSVKNLISFHCLPPDSAHDDVHRVRTISHHPLLANRPVLIIFWRGNQAMQNQICNHHKFQKMDKYLSQHVRNVHGHPI